MQNKRRQNLQHVGKRPFLPLHLPHLPAVPSSPSWSLLPSLLSRLSLSPTSEAGRGDVCEATGPTGFLSFPHPTLPVLPVVSVWFLQGRTPFGTSPLCKPSVCPHMHLHVSSCVPLCAPSHATSCPLRRLLRDVHFVMRWVSAARCRAGWNRL